MYGMPSKQDITYYFKPEIEEQRRVAGHKTNGVVLTNSGFLENEFIDGHVSRLTDGTRRIIIGSIIYDDVAQTARHDVRVTHARDVRRRIRSYGMEPIVAEELATIMQREAILGLADSNLPAGFTAQILETKKGYYVIVDVSPDAAKDITVVNKGIAKLVDRLSDVNGKTH